MPHQKKVIVAKEIRPVLEREKSFLNRSGVRTFSAASNGKALALHKTVKADLIIAKLNTPDMNGETLCSLIREDGELRNVSLIIVCSDSETDLERCIHCRANAFFSSPVDSSALLQEALKLLNIAPRASCRMPVHVRIRGNSGGQRFTGYTENISTSGMLIGAAAALFEGDTITFSLDLPGFAPMAANAEIVRAVGKETGDAANRYGIRFTKISPDLISVIGAYIEKESRRLREA
jgi:CheY-like chemotaxis protein